MQVPLIIGQDNLLTLIRPHGKTFNLRIDEVVKAEVLNTLSSGDVSLRITQKNGDSNIIVARSDMAFEKGSTVYFKVAAYDAELKLQFMGTASDGNRPAGDIASESLPQRILRMISDFAGSRINQNDIKLMEELSLALPERIKSAFPEFRALERIMPEIDKLTSELLKASIEESGVLFETRLKLSMQGGDEKIKAFLATNDYKMDLMKLKDLLQNEGLISSLKGAGINPSEMEKTVDKLLRNLEFFQLTSHVNDAVYTFLPLSWQELRDGELSFKKSRDEKNESYTCEINLDLEPLGKLNVSVTVSEGRFFVTFYTEESSLKEVIGACAGLLESRFSDAGLLLAAVNVTQKEKVSFGVKKERGLHIRI